MAYILKKRNRCIGFPFCITPTLLIEGLAVKLPSSPGKLVTALTTLSIRFKLAFARRTASEH